MNNAELIKELRRCATPGTIIDECDNAEDCKYSEQNLKPCPFCGGKARLIKGDVCWVKCDRCGVETAAETSTTEAIAAWNRRVDDE